MGTDNNTLVSKKTGNVRKVNVLAAITITGVLVYVSLFTELFWSKPYEVFSQSYASLAQSNGTPQSFIDELSKRLKLTNVLRRIWDRYETPNSSNTVSPYHLNTMGGGLETLNSRQQNGRRRQQPSNGRKTEFSLQTLGSVYSSLLTASPRWMPLDKRNPQFSVYAAHYDDTESVPMVVVLLTGPGRQKRFPVVCFFFDSPEVSQPTSMAHGVCQYYSLHIYTFGKRYFGAYIKCPLPSTNLLPYAVSVFRTNSSLTSAFHSYESLITNLMTINYSGRQSAGTNLPLPRWKLTKCFPVLFRYSDVISLIEQIETHRFFGVEHFVIYMHSASPAVHALLQYYVQENVTEVFNWTLPRTTETGKLFFYFDQMDAIQDCLLRHLRSSRYVLFGDLDEFAVPRFGNNLIQLLDRKFAENPQCGGYLFLNTFFKLPYQKDNKGTTHSSSKAGWRAADAHKLGLKTLLVTQRSNYTWVPGKRSKPVVIPTRVNASNVHFIDSFRGNYTQCVLSPSEGLLHHYRRMSPITSKREMLNHAVDVFDPYLRKFADDIVQRVKHMMGVFLNLNVSEHVFVY